MTAWELSDLTLTLGGHAVLQGASLTVGAGERVGLVGSSGCGKTSLVRAGIGLLRADGGTIRVLGRDATGWTRARWHALRGEVQLLFQDPAAMLHPSIPIGLLLSESARIHRPDDDADRAAREVLDRVGLGDRFDAWAHELSGGERRRAGLARVLLARPRLLIADEPTVGLDAALKADLLQLLVERAGPDCAIVLVSHDLPLVAWACDRVAVMDQGRIVESLDRDRLANATHPVSRALLAAGGAIAP